MIVHDAAGIFFGVLAIAVLGVAVLIYIIPILDWAFRKTTGLIGRAFRLGYLWEWFNIKTQAWYDWWDKH